MTTIPANVGPNGVTIPGSASVDYESPDLTIEFLPNACAASGALTYDQTATQQRFFPSFRDYDTITVLKGDVTKTQVNTGTAYEVDSGTAVFQLTGSAGPLIRAPQHAGD